MKTKKNLFSIKNTALAIAAFVVVLASCQKDSEILTASDTQNVNAESASAAYTTESSDMASNTLIGMSSATYSGGRVSSDPVNVGDRDDRLKCAKVTITRTGSKDAPKGTITITFDPTCSDKHNVKRSGTIVINYSGRRWAPGSYFSIHSDFRRNAIHVEGVDSVITKLSADSTTLGYLEFESILTGGKVTFSDGKFITREHDLTREWIRAKTPVDDQWITLAHTTGANGTAAGTNKNGNTYLMQITKQLVHKRSCAEEPYKVFIPVSGTKVITITGKETRQYTVDYGDGSCDNKITVEINGKVKTITVDGEGN